MPTQSTIEDVAAAARETVTPFTPTDEIKALSALVKTLSAMHPDAQRRALAFLNDTFKTQG